jgi:hypothetical protein
MSRWLASFALAVAFLSASLASSAEFTLTKADDGVTVNLDGKLFTRYLIAAGPKPYLWPIISPAGKPITRAFPMDKVEGEKQDHPHHRSFWFTHGNVNDVDFWSENPKHGTIKHREYLKVEGGATATISSTNDWSGPDGKKVCEDTRTITFRTGENSRIIDFDITFKASDGPIVFGDTKEGSFGVRVPTTMDVLSKKGGKIINSEGLTDDAAWGKPAKWVDYHGPVDGAVEGIAILNHPKSFRYPTTWHVRTYGLFAANPFGLRDFTKGAGDGMHKVPAGETMTLRYRVLLHGGDEKAGKVAQAFEEYSKLP